MFINSICYIQYILKMYVDWKKKKIAAVLHDHVEGCRVTGSGNNYQTYFQLLPFCLMVGQSLTGWREFWTEYWADYVTMPACYDDPSPKMEVDDVVFVKSQLGENVNCPGNIKLY